MQFYGQHGLDVWKVILVRKALKANYYAKFGHTDFIIALGYKADVIIEYFNQVSLDEPELSWKIQLVD
ncbi:MAG: hypothetical protein RIR83_968, partial [Pseudomonadota bacterium]